MSGMKSVNLGRLGEKKFSELCTQQSATCNASTEDEHGWDYIVEFDPGHQTTLPADLRDGIIRSLVQVKATQGKKQVARIKLSNALKAIQTDLPCFLVLLVFDGTELAGLFVRHFWNEEIEHILRRAREAHRDGRDDLHKIELQFSFAALEDVQTKLIKVLCSHVSKHGSDYGQEKKTVRDNVGYSETRMVGKFTFDQGTTAKDIVDWQLSDDAQISISNFDLQDMRFDIPASKVDQPTSGTKISVGLTPLEGVLRIVKGAQSLELNAKIYLPVLIGLEHEDFKVRIKTALFDMNLSPRGGGMMQANVIQELVTLWDHYVTAELAGWDESEKVDFQIDCEAGRLFQGYLLPTIEADEWSKRIVAGGRIAMLLAGRQELVDLLAEHGRAWRQISWLAKLEPVFGELPKKLTFQMDAPMDTRCHHVLAFVVFELGDFYYSVNIAFPVKHQNVECNRWEVFFDGVQILNSKRFKTDYASMRSIAQQDFENLVGSRERVSLVLGSGDLIDWFSNDQDRNIVTIHEPD